MSRLYEIPNKWVYICSWILGILLLVWLSTHDRYVAMFTGIFGVGYAIFTFMKPELNPRSKIMYPDHVSDKFFKWTQRVTSVIASVISIFVFFNYRITNTAELGAMSILFCAGILIADIVFIMNFWEGASSLSKSIVAFSLMVCLFLGVIAIFMIMHKSPINMEKYSRPSFIISMVIALLFAQIINMYGDKKLW